MTRRRPGDISPWTHTSIRPLAHWAPCAMAIRKLAWRAARSSPSEACKEEEKNMTRYISQQTGYHDYNSALAVANIRIKYELAETFTYTFENFFHPFVGELIAKLNKGTLKDLLEGQLDPA